MRIQRRISASFPVEMLWIYLPKFISKEKSGGYFVYSYFKIASIEPALSLIETLPGPALFVGNAAGVSEHFVNYTHCKSSFVCSLPKLHREVSSDIISLSSLRCGSSQNQTTFAYQVSIELVVVTV